MRPHCQGLPGLSSGSGVLQVKQPLAKRYFVLLVAGGQKNPRRELRGFRRALIFRLGWDQQPSLLLQLILVRFGNLSYRILRIVLGDLVKDDLGLIGLLFGEIDISQSELGIGLGHTDGGLVDEGL